MQAFFLVYESGGEMTLAEELRRRGRVRPPRALELCAQVCEGLGAAHRAGVLHLDLKPANVGLRRLSDGTEHAVLLDAVTTHLLAQAGLRDAAPLPIASAAYTAPEQASGTAADERSDLYAVGVIAYELLTGVAPRPGEPPASPPYPTPAPRPDGSVFDRCDRRLLATPVLHEPEVVTDGGIRLSWEPSDDPDASYELQEIGEHDGWDAAETLVDGPDLSLELYGRAPGAWHYRVRAHRGISTSDWSPPVTAIVDPRPAYEVDESAPIPAATLLAVQRAMLRLAGTRGDLLCVLQRTGRVIADREPARRGEFETEPE